MSFDAFKWVGGLTFKAPVEAAVMYTLAQYHNPTKRLVWPSVNTLAERCGCSTSSIKRCLNTLEARGWINREARTHENGSKASNGYALLFEPLSAERLDGSHRPIPEKLDGSHRPDGRVTVTHPIYEPVIEPVTPHMAPQGAQLDLQDEGLSQPSPAKPDLNEAFDRFWDNYPRKIDKIAAKKKFLIIAKQYDPEAIIYGAAAYRDDPKRTPDYTKLATTFLNKGSWENYERPEPADYSKRPVEWWSSLLKAVSRHDKPWPDTVCPPPGHPGCLVPQELITPEVAAKYGAENIIALAEHRR